MPKINIKDLNSYSNEIHDFNKNKKHKRTNKEYIKEENDDRRNKNRKFSYNKS